jgi:diguanylate cyclase
MFVVIHYVTYVGIAAHAAFIGFFAWLHLPSLAIFNVFSVAAWVVARVANQRQHRSLAAGLIATEVLCHAILAVALLGWDSGFHNYLIPVIPFLLFDDDLPTRLVVAGSTVVSALYVALHAWAPAATIPLPSWVPLGNILVPFLALGLISVYFRSASLDAEQRMAELAMTDALTRLPNRRHLRALLEQEAVRYTRSGRVFSIVFSDIDGFKQINDSRGHDRGDLVLRELAQLLRSALREQDQVARWGGEEFLFLLPETDCRGAKAIAEKLRGAVERMVLPSSPPVSTTMTFGIA